jgi:hypothetical protein
MPARRQPICPQPAFPIVRLVVRLFNCLPPLSFDLYRYSNQALRLRLYDFDRVGLRRLFNEIMGKMRSQIADPILGNSLLI